MNKIFLYFLMSLITLIVAFCGNDFIKLNGYYFIITHMLIGFLLIGRSLMRLLSPISLIYFYTTLSLAGGSWGFANEYIILDSLEVGFNSWKQTNFSLAILLLNLTIFIIVGERFISKSYFPIKLKKISFKKLLIASIVFLPFFFFELDLNFLGGGGDLSTLPKTLFALFVILYIQKYPILLRYIGYIGVILFLSTISIHEKREAFFLLFPIMFFESLHYNLKLNLKSAVGIFILMAYSLVLILAMSIARGYGGYGEFSSIFSTLSFIPAYMSNDIFIGGLLLNIEVGYFYFHGVNAIELVLNDPTIISVGSTLIKPLFLFIPRFIYPYKPEQIITLYTQEFDPAFRLMGGSYPISIFSEFFWNFHLAGIFMIIFLIIFCHYIYENQINSVQNFNVPKILFFMVCYLNIIMLARGSGLDMYALFIILSGCFIICYSFLESVFNKDKKLVKYN